jgi:hypothetical protein
MKTGLIMKNSIQTSGRPAHQDIATEAYLLWEKAGHPTGRAEEFWLRAEAALVAAKNPPASKAAAAPVSAAAIAAPARPRETAIAANRPAVRRARPAFAAERKAA